MASAYFLMRSADVRESARPVGICARVRSESSSTRARPRSEMEQTTFLRSSAPSARSMSPSAARWFVRWVIVGLSAPWYSAIAEVFIGSSAISSRQRIANSSKVRRSSEEPACLTMLYALLTDMNSLRSTAPPLTHLR